MKQHLAYLLCLAALSLSGCGGSSSAEPIFIGHVATLSGPQGKAGQQAALGIRLALVDKAKAQVDGRPLAARHTDTRGQLEAFEAEAVRLVAISRVAALYGGANASELARLDRGQATILSPLGYRPAGVGDQVFCIGLSPKVQGEKLAHYAVRRLVVTSLLHLAPVPAAPLPMPAGIVILKDESSDSADMAVDAFRRTWQEHWSALQLTGPRLEVVTLATAAGADVKLPTPAPSGILVAGGPQTVQRLVPVLKATDALLLFAGSDDPLDVPDGMTVYRVSAFARDAQQVKQFAQKFRDAFKSEPDVHAALAHDAARLLAAALPTALAGTQTLPASLRALKNFPSLTGPVTFTAEQTVDRQAFLLSCEGSGERLVE